MGGPVDWVLFVVNAGIPVVSAWLYRRAASAGRPDALMWCHLWRRIRARFA